MARGWWRVKTDPTGALADFKEATTLVPHYYQAWQNQAHVLAECLHETDLAIAAMDEAVKANPQYAEALMGRAVLLARIGKRDESHADVDKGLLMTNSGLLVYQAACAYALTSRTHPQDSDRAFMLLRQAIREGYLNLKQFREDPDWNALRENPEFQRIMEAAKTIVN
jgi:tetratricopeptide (TPR) repeat protein